MSKKTTQKMKNGNDKKISKRSLATIVFDKTCMKVCILGKTNFVSVMKIGFPDKNLHSVNFFFFFRRNQIFNFAKF